MPVVLIPTAYRAPTQGKAEVEVSGSTIRECLDALEERHPGFLELVLDPEGNQHPFVKLFVNAEQIEANALETQVSSEGRIEVLAAIAGG
ncbi:MAG: MoaD/ThiS family protein [Myxococcota bacterium]